MTNEDYIKFIDKLIEETNNTKLIWQQANPTTVSLVSKSNKDVLGRDCVKIYFTSVKDIGLIYLCKTDNSEQIIIMNVNTNEKKPILANDTDISSKMTRLYNIVDNLYNKKTTTIDDGIKNFINKN